MGRWTHTRGVLVKKEAEADVMSKPGSNAVYFFSLLFL